MMEPRKAELMQRKRMVDDFARQFASVMNQTGFGNAESTRITLQWFEKTKLSDDASDLDSILSREDYIAKSGRKKLAEGLSVHHTFMSTLQKAEKFMSKKSKARWLERYYDSKQRNDGGTKSMFEIKKEWIQTNFEAYANRWIELGTKYDTAMKDPSFKTCLSSDPKLTILLDRESFLDLPYPERMNRFLQAEALQKAQEKSFESLYQTARGKLRDAAAKGSFLESKTGKWLQKIVESKAKPALIKEFVEGNSSTSLSTLIQRWSAVRQRYDKVVTQMKERDPDIAARGLTLKSPTEFLKMHYAERLTYVTDLENRLHSSENIENEKGVMLELRHAIDIKDWDMANELLIKAQTDPTLDIQDRSRLISMEKQIKKEGSTEKSSASPEQVTNAKARIDRTMQMMQQTHPQMISLVTKLLTGLHANRAIHQLRWTTYNNIWCRTNGPPYLDDDIARTGASEDHEQMTKFRAEQGLDVGRHDSLNYETSDSKYFRKQEDWEKSRSKATYMHTNLASGGVLNAVGEFYQREHPAKRMYWTTMCFHDDGEPKGDNWHRELLMMLTELRSCTATLQKAGFRYAGPSSGLIGIN